jgi:hypothetical protein
MSADQTGVAFGRRTETETVEDPVIDEAKARAMKRMDLLEIDERRADVRQPAFRAGELDLPDGRTLACIVRNMTGHGCKLKLSVDDELPDRFTVRVDGDTAARPAKIIWREHGAVGVRFLR